MADRIAELRALLADATQGALERRRGPHGSWYIDSAAGSTTIVHVLHDSMARGSAETAANADLYHQAKTSLPLLLDVAEAARKAREDVVALRRYLGCEYKAGTVFAYSKHGLILQRMQEALDTALAALEGEDGATTTPPATDSRPRHSTNELGDCPHWCRACAIEAKERAALEAHNGAD